MDYQHLGARIRQRRVELGWTQEHLAREIGVSTSYVGHIERGSRKASLETLVLICNAMGVTADDLLSGSLHMENKLLVQPEDLRPRQRLVLREILTTMQQQLDHWYDPEPQPENGEENE